MGFLVRDANWGIKNLQLTPAGIEYVKTKLDKVLPKELSILNQLCSDLDVALNTDTLELKLYQSVIDLDSINSLNPSQLCTDDTLARPIKKLNQLKLIYDDNIPVDESDILMHEVDAFLIVSFNCLTDIYTKKYTQVELDNIAKDYYVIAAIPYDYMTSKQAQSVVIDPSGQISLNVQYKIELPDFDYFKLE